MDGRDLNGEPPDEIFGGFVKTDEILGGFVKTDERLGGFVKKTVFEFQVNAA